MTHDQLARVFPNGRTVHVASDGQPLSGYALSLADIERRGTSAPSVMSLTAARNSGAVGEDRVASAAKPKKGNVLAKLFGFSTDDEEEDEATPASGTTVVAAREEAPAARVPMPQARPQAIEVAANARKPGGFALASATSTPFDLSRSEEHTSELQSPCNLVCRLLLEKKKIQRQPLGQTRTALP